MVKDTTMTIIGVLAGIFFGINAVTFLLELIEGSMEMISMLGSGVGLAIAIIIAVIVILKIRIVTSLLTGAVIGIVANILSKAIYNVDIATWIMQQLFG